MASRRIEDLHPIVADKCKALINLCADKGINLIVTSTLRTPEEQLAYYSQGRKTLETVNELREEAGLPPITEKENSKIITKLQTSIHQFGCAFDIAIVKDNKVIWDVKVNINNNDIPDYEEIGKLGEYLGLVWGGRFKFKDCVHFEYTGGLSLPELKAGKRPA